MTKTVLAGASTALLLSSCIVPPPLPPPPYQDPSGGYYGPARPNPPQEPYGAPGPDAPPPGPGPQDYPIAEKTGNPNRVISPYGPNYNVIDVTGFRSGALARDPSNNKIFRVP